MSAATTMYMHTLDGEPASYTVSSYDGEPYIHFVGGRNAAKLVPTLRQLRREQREAIAAAQRSNPGNAAAWGNPRRYGYVLVEVPRG